MRSLPLTLLVVFALIDAAANWRLIPAQTVSEWVWSLGSLGRAAAAVLLALIFAHLVFQWPLGPDASERRALERARVGEPALSVRRQLRRPVPLTLATMSAVAVAAIGGADGATASPPSTTKSVVGPTAVRDDALVSTNWAGYAVSGSPAATPLRFSSVGGRWVQPSATCMNGQPTYSAFWVGLGGFSATSPALEQIGTTADCTIGGRPTYAMWYELVPAPSVPIKLKVVPGNVIAAYVAVAGNNVTLEIRNLTRRTRFKKVVRVAQVDVSSAEWIAEAPSACDSPNECVVLPLTDFGAVTFTRAAATAVGHKGPISDLTWAAAPIELAASATPTETETATPTPAVGAIPSALSPAGSAFTVTFQSSASPG